MATGKTPHQNRIKDALARIYDEHPPQFREYLRRFQQDPKSRVFAPLAEAYRKMGRTEDALSVCLKGITHHPDFHGGRVALARCYIDLKELGKAKEHLEIVIQKVPENLLAQRILGDVLLTTKDLDGAIHRFKMALRLAPDDVVLAEKVYQLEKRKQEGDAGLVEESSAEPLSDIAESSNEDEIAAEKADVAVAGPSPSGGHWDVLRDEGAAGLAPIGGLAGPKPEDALVQWDDLLDVEDRLPFTEEEQKAGMARILGLKDEEFEEPFHAAHVSAVFNEKRQKREITTETLGDLYFSQKQYDKALRIFETINEQSPTTELTRKIDDCRERLGVDAENLERQKKIDKLQGVLEKLKDNPATP